MEIQVEIGAAFTGGIAAVAAIVGLIQYKKSENWKRAEFTGRLLEQLSSNEELAFASRSLDWGVGPLIVPIKYRVLYKVETNTISHEWSRFAKAVRPGLEFDFRTEIDLLVYRYCFDAFCDFLDRLRIFVELRLIKLEDLSSLGYYAALMHNPIYYGGPLKKEKVLGDFLKKFYPALPDFLSKIPNLKEGKTEETGQVMLTCSVSSDDV